MGLWMQGLWCGAVLQELGSTSLFFDLDATQVHMRLKADDLPNTFGNTACPLNCLFV